MSDDQINYLRMKAVKLREVAADLNANVSAKLMALADEFELKADELEAAARQPRTIC